MESKGYPSKTAAAAISMQNQKESTFGESSVSLGNRLSKILFNSSSLNGDNILITAFKNYGRREVDAKDCDKMCHCDILAL